MKAKLFLCSDSAAIDLRMNSLSIFHIMDELNAASFPFFIPRMTVVLVLTRGEDEPTNAELRLRFLLGEKELHAAPITASFQHHLMYRNIIDLFGLLVPGPGDLTIEVLAQQGALATWVVKINSVTEVGMQLTPLIPTATLQPQSDQHD